MTNQMTDAQLISIAEKINFLFVSEANETAIMDKIIDEENIRRMAWDAREELKANRLALDAILEDEYMRRRASGASVDIFPKLQNVKTAIPIVCHSALQ